ncbi:hypothetical protein Rhopal_006706-T1 [Rhodotorula paludigena]|uniref:Uncharacterized protein n=1 Tax=Rhodotorula paludigena TaxID=86838 RepID=A0AAV5GWU0_9BASI|nr:hypothetical protein Rhopal_006706-T1 [Rhodotorula paludigena]
MKEPTAPGPRSSNGGAGQSGLVGALAKAYIDYSIANGTADSPYLIDWVTGDTTDSIRYLKSGDADIAITYNAAAEYQALNSSTRFLSRFDRSATNIKESLLFATIGQVPWASYASRWYHQYSVFPIQALTAAAVLGEYTLSDRGTFLTLQSQDSSLTDVLTLYKAGGDEDPADLLLNPASVLLGANICEKDRALAEGFLDWIVLPDGGQAVVSKYVQPGSTDILYTAAPNCTTQPDHCAGW